MKWLLASPHQKDYFHHNVLLYYILYIYIYIYIYMFCLVLNQVLEKKAELFTIS